MKKTQAPLKAIINTVAQGSSRGYHRGLVFSPKSKMCNQKGALSVNVWFVSSLQMLNSVWKSGARGIFNKYKQFGLHGLLNFTLRGSIV